MAAKDSNLHIPFVMMAIAFACLCIALIEMHRDIECMKLAIPHNVYMRDVARICEL